MSPVFRGKYLWNGRIPNSHDRRFFFCKNKTRILRNDETVQVGRGSQDRFHEDFMEVGNRFFSHLECKAPASLVTWSCQMFRTPQVV